MTAPKVVRTSKFRHVFGTGGRKEGLYDGVNVSLDSNDWHLIKANTKFLSIHWDSAGGGAFLIHPLQNTGRISTSSIPLYTGHAGPVLDTDFHPFNEHVIASAGEDGRVLIWNIPKDGPNEASSNFASELKGHERRIIDLAWHPTVDSLLASASHDLSVRLWDVSGGSCRQTLSGHADVVIDQCWSFDGSRLVTSSKDKTMRIFDPRKGNTCILQKPQVHLGVKGIRVVWLGDQEQILTTGFGKASEREVSLWDARKLDEAITTLSLGSASGPLLPYYDADCKIVYLAGRGDGNIRYYELVNEAPYLYALSEYKSVDPQRGLAMLPKRAVNVTENEVARFVKVYGSQPILESISFKVPRRDSSVSFAQDIYPDTLAPEPAMTVEEYFAGSNKTARKMSLQNQFIPPSLQEMKLSSVNASSSSSNNNNQLDTSTEPPKDEEQLRKAWQSLFKENTLLKSELDQKTVRIRQLEAKLQLQQQQQQQ